MVQLQDGTEICLRDLRVSATYEGMLHQVRTSEFNQDLIAWHIHELRSEFPGLKVVTLPAFERPMEISQPELLGTPASLPTYHCVGRFQRVDAIAGEEWLGVVWYQEELPMPVDERVMAQLKRLTWNAPRPSDTELLAAMA